MNVETTRRKSKDDFDIPKGGERVQGLSTGIKDPLYLASEA